MTAVLPSLVAIYVDGVDRSHTIVEQSQKEQLRLTQAIAFQYESQTQGIRQLLAAFALVSEVQQLDSVNCTRIFKESIHKNQDILNIALVDAHGTLVASGLPLPQTIPTLAGSKVFQDSIISGDFSVGEYQIDPVGNKPTLQFGKPFFAENGKLRGVLVTSLNLDIFLQICRNLKLSEGQTFNLSDHRGILLTRFPRHNVVTPGSPDKPELRKKVTGPDEEGTFFGNGRDGVNRLLGFKRLRLAPGMTPYIYLRLTIPEKELLETIQHERSRNLLILLISTMFALLTAWMLGNRVIVRHILNISEFARRLPSSRGDTVTLDSPPPEIRELEDALNYASKELKLMESDLLFEQERLHSALDQKEIAEKDLQQLNLELENKVKFEVERSREKDAILLQQARFTMLGEMLMNISHQWRQPLNSIGLQVQEMVILLQQEQLAPEQAEKICDSIMKQLTDLSQIIERFRQFNRKTEKSSAFLMPVEATRVTISMLSGTLDAAGIKISLTGNADVPINCSFADFSTCIINIITNAREAILVRGIRDGHIDIAIEAISSTRNRIRIANNGIPISEAIIGRIFDAYVTTKFHSQGVGLGLFIVRQIVEKIAGGSISAQNTPSGAEFILEI
jgi:signal transduction histidine kinase